MKILNDLILLLVFIFITSQIIKLINVLKISKFSLIKGNYQIVDFADFKKKIESNEILNENDFKEKSKKIKLKKDLVLFEVEQKLKEHFSSSKIFLVIRKATRKSGNQPKVLNARKTIRQDTELKTNIMSNQNKKLEENNLPDSSNEKEKEREMVNGFKTLRDLFVTPNQLIFIDRSDGKGKSNWVEYFKKENHMIVLNFNFPERQGITADKVEYKYQIKVDVRKRLSDLKDNIMQKIQKLVQKNEIQKNNQISENINLETKNQNSNDIKENVLESEEIRKTPNFNILKQLIETQKKKETNLAFDFIMKKGGRSGIELKDLRKTVRQKGFINNSFLYLIFGSVSHPGDISINLFLCLNPLNSNNFELRRKIIKFGETQIRNNWKVTELISNLKERYPALINQTFLLREMVSNVPTKVYRNYSLKRQFVVERKKIVIELTERDLPDKDQIFLYYCVLSENEELINNGELDELVLGPIREITINRQSLLKEVGNFLLDDLKKSIDFQSNNKIPQKSEHDKDSKLLLDSINKEIPKNLKKTRNVNNLIPTLEQLKTMVKSGVEKLTCTKIKDVGNFLKEDIITHRFFSLNQNDKLLSTAPFYLDLDGCLFILKRKELKFSQKLKNSLQAQGIRNEKFWGKSLGPEKQLEIFVKTRSPQK